MLKKKVVAFFILNKPNAAKPNFSPKISTDFPRAKKMDIFW
jgi:hypothetical protein